MVLMNYGILSWKKGKNQHPVLGALAKDYRYSWVELPKQFASEYSWQHHLAPFRRIAQRHCLLRRRLCSLSYHSGDSLWLSMF